MWRSCKKPPIPFLRVEVRDIHGRLYLGFYAGHKCWLQTEGHEVIKDPDVWRFIKADSMLEKAFKFKMFQRDLAKARGCYGES